MADTVDVSPRGAGSAIPSLTPPPPSGPDPEAGPGPGTHPDDAPLTEAGPGADDPAPARTDAEPMTDPGSGLAARPSRLRSSSRHGRHARGFEPRPGRRPSLSIRSAEGRTWSADLSGPGPAGLVLHGVGGIGKSTLAAQIAQRVSRVRAGQTVITLSGAVTVASFPAQPAETDFMILDNFDDNLRTDAAGSAVADPALAALLAGWPGKLLITCRHPFTLNTPAPAAAPGAAAAPALAPAAPAAVPPPVPPGVVPLASRHAAVPLAEFAELAGIPAQRPTAATQPTATQPAATQPAATQPTATQRPAARPRLTQPARDRLVFRRLGPLTRSGAWELAGSLPALRLLADCERARLWRLTAGHPLAMELLDSLLAMGAGYPEVAGRIEAAVLARQARALPPGAPTEWPEATADLVAAAAGDRLAGDLFERLSAGSRSLLVRASVFRRPVPGDVLAARPAQVAEAQTAGLLGVGSRGELSVHRWTAAALHHCLTEAGLAAQLADAHRRAAGYWRGQTAAARTAPGVVDPAPAADPAPAGAHPAPADAQSAPADAQLEADHHDRQVAGSGPDRPPARRELGPGTGARRRLALRLAATGLVAALAAVVAIDAAQGSPHVAVANKAAVSLPAPVAQAIAVRGQVAAWVAQQVSSGAILACDPAMCAVLVRHGIPAGRLLVLGPAAADPLGSAVVLATSAVRGMFGNRLASVYAPEVLASFGSGQARIDIRAVAPDGAAAYLAALATDLRARRVAGRQLLRDAQLSFSGAARAQLTAGQVDARLLITLATLAASEPVRVAAFLDDGPGASPGLPLRAAELTAGPSAAGRIGAFFRAQRPPYQPTVTDSQAAPVLTVRFSAPAPLGLLPPSP
jgi:hypothetical protein